MPTNQEKLKKFIDSKNLAFFEELQELKENLQKLTRIKTEISKVEGLENFDEDKDLATFKEIQEINNLLNKFKLISLKGDKGDSIKGDDGKSIKGDDGKTPTKKELKELIKPLIPKSKKGDKGDSIKGDKPTNKEITELIRPLIPEPIKGEDGHIKDLSPQEQRDSLELLQDNERLDVSAIKGIDKLIKKSTNNIIPSVATPSGRDLFSDLDISDQLNGVLKTFDIPATWNILSVALSSYPYGALRKGIDYIFSPTTITFTSEIDASTQLEAGQTCVLTLVVS